MSTGTKRRAKQPTGSQMIFNAIQALETEQNFVYEDIIDVIKTSLITAYKKHYGTSENIQITIDQEKQEFVVKTNKIVVDKVVLEGMQIHIDDARKIKKDVKLGDYIDIVEDIDNPKRFVTQIAIKTIAQGIRTLEQKKIRTEYEHKIGELVVCNIIRKKGNMVFANIGGSTVEAIMPFKHQIPNEKYRVEDKVKVLLHSIEEDKGRSVRLIVSRSDKNFVKKLFEMEVPEIYENVISIRTIGRVPGIRSKIVVSTEMSEVDPVGACVGIKGVRIQAVVRELGNERIDIVEYSPSMKTFVTNAISPAKPIFVRVDEVNKYATVVVADKELSLAIGRDGSNVKLASFITNCKIDVKSESAFSEDMTQPQAKRSFDELFSSESNVQEDEPEEAKNLLSDLDGLSKRVIKMLNQSNIKYVEDLLGLEESELIALEGIGKHTAAKIMEIIAENVEFESEE